MLAKRVKLLISAGLATSLGIALLALLIVSVSGRTATGAGTGNSLHKLTFGGRTRTYEVHLPPSYDGRKPLPVVLNLHGGGGNATVQRRQSQMDKTADRHGFIVVYPEGTAAFGRLLTWNAGICCGYAKNHNVDDVGFFARLLDELPKQYSIDTARVYSTGMSNGAAMSYRLACELPDRIVAICAVASTMGVDGPRPTRPVPIMQIQGLKDPIAPFAGGFGKSLPRVDRRSVRDVIRWWCEVDDCTPEPSEVVQTADYVMERYNPPAGRPGAPIVLYMLPEGGHTWPGGVDVTAYLGTGKLIETFDANTTMWEFFRQFSLPRTGAQ
jgi:polyhydroxybutyrate depolymerase